MDHLPDEMTLRDYLAVIRRRWWIVVGAFVVTTGIALGLSATQTAVYEAEAQMLVQTRTTDSLFDTGVDLRGSDATRAVQTEIRVLEGERVQTRLEQNLGLDSPPPAVNARVLGATDVISVRVRSTNPETAQTLANAYVQAYIDERREQAVDDLIAASAQVQTKITELQGQIESLPETDPQRSALLAQQSTFRQTLNQLQVDTALKTGGASVVKSADIPTDPVEPTPLRTGALAGVVGLLLGLAAAFAIDYFDDSVRSEEDLERLSPVPVLAVVPVDTPPDNRPVAISSPGDYAVETYRGLRTNLQFLALDRRIKVIQVTSSLPGEGKTTTATNLACVLAQAGKSVVIVDADLRRPRVHEVFATPSAPGVIDLLVGEAVAVVARPLEIAEGTTLTVVPSGTVPGNPGELLSSQRSRDMLGQLAQEFDYVVVDSAPVLPVADSIALAGGVDAVLFVAQSRRTSRRQVAESLERLGRVHAPVVGLVLNQASKTGTSGTYGYGYSYGPEGADNTPPDSLTVGISTPVDEPAGLSSK
ncbi:MAG: polysaccharide biosynthesis tyrosine autokinase [Ilumatobacter sp.]|uniref:polysaccharide biosynthesis tyrosine autokinase n=1 Tax=Ilumatobacter sp. TaxID=1967498 RepID=UPI002635C2B2|nr:polysaccharide biosynthesis tyrosine autokinase [Ilumatobacter sp.]MDJ0771448.1 polysaccharide biosynthesis tyrosine autokinase [Ilumatobacter sp.]